MSLAKRKKLLNADHLCSPMSVYPREIQGGWFWMHHALRCVRACTSVSHGTNSPWAECDSTAYREMASKPMSTTSFGIQPEEQPMLPTMRDMLGGIIHFLRIAQGDTLFLSVGEMQLHYKINDRWLAFSSEFGFPGEFLSHVSSVMFLWSFSELQPALSMCPSPAVKRFRAFKSEQKSAVWPS